eukprot:8653782-Alexandrium_andersonii.AAC.1
MQAPSTLSRSSRGGVLQVACAHSVHQLGSKAARAVGANEACDALCLSSSGERGPNGGERGVGGAKLVAPLRPR